MKKLGLLFLVLGLIVFVKECSSDIWSTPVIGVKCPCEVTAHYGEKCENICTTPHWVEKYRLLKENDALYNCLIKTKDPIECCQKSCESTGKACKQNCKLIGGDDVEACKKKCESTGEACKQNCNAKQFILTVLRNIINLHDVDGEWRTKLKDLHELCEKFATKMECCAINCEAMGGDKVACKKGCSIVDLCLIPTENPMKCCEENCEAMSDDIEACKKACNDKQFILNTLKNFKGQPESLSKLQNLCEKFATKMECCRANCERMGGDVGACKDGCPYNLIVPLVSKCLIQGSDQVQCVKSCEESCETLGGDNNEVAACKKRCGDIKSIVLNALENFQGSDGLDELKDVCRKYATGYECCTANCRRTSREQRLSGDLTHHCIITECIEPISPSQCLIQGAPPEECCWWLCSRQREIPRSSHGRETPNEESVCKCKNHKNYVLMTLSELKQGERESEEWLKELGELIEVCENYATKFECCNASCEAMEGDVEGCQKQCKKFSGPAK